MEAIYVQIHIAEIPKVFLGNILMNFVLGNGDTKNAFKISTIGEDGCSHLINL